MHLHVLMQALPGPCLTYFLPTPLLGTWRSECNHVLIMDLCTLSHVIMSLTMVMQQLYKGSRQQRQLLRRLAEGRPHGPPGPPGPPKLLVSSLCQWLRVHKQHPFAELRYQVVPIKPRKDATAKTLTNLFPKANTFNFHALLSVTDVLERL